jgi:hypothetical protein
MRVSSNYLILSFNLAFSSSMCAIETSSASLVNLLKDDNLEGNISRVSMVDRNFPLLLFVVLSKSNFLDSLSKHAFCTTKVSSSENVSS